MDLLPILSTSIVTATVATVILALISYAAFKLRDRRGPTSRRGEPGGSAKTFFIRYQPAADEDARP